MSVQLRDSNELCRLLADGTRVRMLSLLEEHKLTVAELTEVLQIAQSRVSTHLARLKDAGLVRAHRSGAASYYGINEASMPKEAARLWSLIQETTTDPLLDDDLIRADEVILRRAGGASWADSVAGNMERHYSPGRTCEATLRGLLGFVRLGDVVDIGSGDGVIAELLAPRAKSVTCVDVSEKVVNAGKRRLGKLGAVQFVRADMHAMPFNDQHFDHALLLNTLTYSPKAPEVLDETFRVLRPGGNVACVTLKRHAHEAAVSQYNHQNLGFELDELTSMFEDAGFAVDFCDVTSRERRPPHFEVVTVHASRPKENR